MKPEWDERMRKRHGSEDTLLPLGFTASAFSAFEDQRQTSSELSHCGPGDTSCFSALSPSHPSNERWLTH